RRKNSTATAPCRPMRASRACWPAKITAPIALSNPIALTAVAIAVTCSAQFGMDDPPIDGAALRRELGATAARLLDSCGRVVAAYRWASIFTSAVAPLSRAPCLSLQDDHFHPHGNPSAPAARCGGRGAAAGPRYRHR